MAEQCAHENITVTQVWSDDQCLESHVRCDDCGTDLK